MTKVKGLSEKELLEQAMLLDAVKQMEYDVLHPVLQLGRIPVEWSALAGELSVPVKEKLTVRFDADVVKFYRSLGRGYQAKMNTVLRGWMMMRIVGLINGPEARTERRMAEFDSGEARPEMGETLKRVREVLE